LSYVRQYNGTITSDLAGSALNSLAAGAGAYCSEFDNSLSTALWVRGVVQFKVDFGTGPTAGTLVDIYFVPAIDGVNYPDGNVTSIASNPSVSMIMRNTTDQQTVVAPLPLLLPCKTKPYVVNRTNQPFNSSGMELLLLPGTDQITAS